MTYKAMMELFKEDYPKLVDKVIDYRPGNGMSIKICFYDQTTKKYDAIHRTLT